MSENIATIERYIDGFNKSDHAQILDCLTDDVEWVLPGAFHLHGKQEFDGEIENDAFTGSPVVVLTRVVEADEIVFAEGTVQAHWKDGRVLNAAFCDVFEMRGGKIRKLISYLNQLP